MTPTKVPKHQNKSRGKNTYAENDGRKRTGYKNYLRRMRYWVTNNANENKFCRAKIIIRERNESPALNISLKGQTLKEASDFMH